MIKGILLTISIIVLVAVIGLAVWLGIKAFRSSTSAEIAKIKRKYENKIDSLNSWDGNYIEKKKALKAEMDAEIEEYKKSNPGTGKGGFLASIIGSIALFAFVLTVPGSFHQVETGTVAVVRELGRIVDVRTPGTYFDFYMIRNYEVYDTKVQQDKIITAAYSKDGQTMDLEVFLQYQVQTEHIMDIATQYGNLDALQSRIETQTIEKTKAVMSSDIAMNIIQNRAQFSNDVSTAVREGISSDYYVNIKDVVLTNIDFTDEFEKAVEDKVIAEQEKQAAITRAEAELEVAKLEAQKKIEEARGNAEAQKILAKAAAEAATYNIVELARTLGYTINETYTYTTEVKVEKTSGYSSITTSESTSVNAKLPESTEVVITTEGTGDEQVTVTTTTMVSLTATRYDIEIPDDADSTARFKSLVEDYLAYLAYLEAWNGQLPDVVSGDESISIIVPNGN